MLDYKKGELGSGGKNRKNKKCDKKYHIRNYPKGLPNPCAVFNAYSHDLSYGSPVSWIKFFVCIRPSGDESCRTGGWFSDDL